MLKKLFAEFVGTFVLSYVILSVVKSKVSIVETGLAIGLALAVAIFMTGQVSGGHYNPVVSLVMFVDSKIKMDVLLQYVVAQALGGVGALMLFKM